MARHRAAYLLCAAGLLVSSAFGLLVPWMTKRAIDGLAAPGGRPELVRAVCWMIAFAALHAAFRYLARKGLLTTARRIEQDLRDALFAHVVRLPMSFFSAAPTGDIMSRLTNDVSAVWLLLGPGGLTLAGTLVSYVLALGFMVRISPALTLAAVLIAPAIVILSREYGRAFHRRHRLVQESLAAMSAAIQENVSGIRIVKAYGLEEREEERFAGRCRDYYRHNVAVSKTQAAFHGATGFLSGAGLAVVLGLGGWLVIRKELTLGGFVAFNAYIAMLAFPTMALGWVINLVQRGESAMGRINEFLRHPVEPETLPVSPIGPAAGEAEAGHRGPAEGRGSPGGSERREGFAAKAGAADYLRVTNLVFAHGGPANAPVLRGVSFSVGRKELVGLVGPTGCGKSTLLSLLLRLLPVPPGSVFLEGRDICTIPLAELRGRIGIVAQDPFLFSDTLLENVAFAAPEPAREAARRAAAQARLLAEIDGMPAGIDTLIGERGISLSGGQKQRATIARALYAGRELLLLDDALSSVDSETEREIFEELFRARAGRTILFATHRMASLSRCDRILVLSGGAIVEEGSHDALLSRRGAYYDLYSRQMLAGELERF